MDLKKIIVILAVALLLFFLISSPTQSANVVKDILTALRSGAESVISFVQSLFA